MRVLKKSICSLLILMLLANTLSAIPQMTVKASSNMSLTQLQQKFPEGAYWNHAGSSSNNPDGYTWTPCTHHGNCSKNGTDYSGWCGCNSFSLSIQCMGFANKLAYDAFGSLPRNWSQTNLSNLKAGDVIRYKNNGHSIFVTGVNGDTITYGDCNSDGHCKIRWNKTISKATVQATLTAVYSAPSELSTNVDLAVDLGTNFYGVILNTGNWKPITLESDGFVRLGTEVGSANQLWKFVRQEDGSYTISSAKNGKLLEMYLGNTESGNPVAAVSDDWGGNYQRWYIYRQGNGYVLLSKHYVDLGLVLDLTENKSADGTAIITYPRNNGAAQIWSIYKEKDVQLSGPTLSVLAGTSETSTKFTWNEVCGESHYDIKIWKGTAWEGEAYHVEWGATSGYEIKLPAGTYQAYVDAGNYYETIMGNVVTFTVPEHLSNLQVSISETDLCVDDTLEVIASVDGGADYYAIQIWKEDQLVYSEEFTGHKFTLSCKQLGVGEYACYVTAVNSIGTLGSDVYNFRISDKAEGDNEIAEDIGSLSITNVSRKQGDTVAVPIIIEKNPGIIAIQCKLQYDSSKVKLVKVESSDMLDGSALSTDYTKNPYVLSLGDDLATENITATGELVTAYFELLSDFKEGSTEIELIFEEAYDKDLNEVTFESCTGKIEIKDYISGDVNGDGQVKLNDAILLRRYVAGWDVTIDTLAGDVNGDGQVKLNDAILLRRYVAGWDVTLK